MTTVEKQLETAYAALTKANEPALADTPFRLSTLILAQPPVASDEENAEVEQMPPEYILLTAREQGESIPNSGVIETELTIEAGANAEIASADGGRLDALFAAACRPLFYKTITDETQDPPVTLTLFQALSAAVSNFKVYGMPRRSNGTEMEDSGSMIMRRITATFFCQNTTPAS